MKYVCYVNVVCDLVNIDAIVTR